MPKATTATDDQSDLITGMSRRAVAKAMGISTAKVEAIELKFRMRLYQKLAADPETLKFLRHPPTNQSTK